MYSLLFLAILMATLNYTQAMVPIVARDCAKKCTSTTSGNPPLKTDNKKKTEKEFGEASTLWDIICTESTVFRTVYLREPWCWARAAPYWTRCVEDLLVALYDIDEHSKLMVHFNKNKELCCARDEFVECVAWSGRTCSPAVQAQLQQIASLYAQSEVACTHSYPHCPATPAAPARAPPSHAAPLLAAITALLLYPAWL